ncbi:DUF3422 family protein [Methyloversatilis thermotolerans]|uniref:DUF3422 family protein n=1 Tax=Methyloversatilis thermotolerans TaxID=1346290 RepID=UPI00036C6C4F|nr:DUF3422 domain-containing protein [Methyloversatilis thermotolerans]
MSTTDPVATSRLTEHPLRYKLNNELHARPPVPLTSPHIVSYVALMHEGLAVGEELKHLQALADAFARPLPQADGGHLHLDVGEFKLKWERHNEFSSYAFFRTPKDGEDTSRGALPVIPAGWLESLPGSLMVATHIEVRSTRDLPPDVVKARLISSGRQAVGAQVSDGAAWVFTDFTLTDGWSRITVLDERLAPRQAGRTVQRLFEIETYRVIALLAFPVAKDVGHLLGRAEGELAQLMDGMGAAASSDDEREVLSRLTRLAAEVEHSVARTTFRFGAAQAYYKLVRSRISELREQRIEGFPTIGEFMERRLTPAISTCEAIARRQEDLSGRVARNSQLLRTRVDIELQRQNQELLAQMNRRARLQLRLQQTVEGLSIVAITYYASQLVQYVSKGLKPLLPINPDIVTAISIPLIAGAAALAMRSMRRKLEAEEE